MVGNDGRRWKEDRRGDKGVLFRLGRDVEGVGVSSGPKSGDDVPDDLEDIDGLDKRL